MKKLRAFTLIEVMVVVAIIGILAAVLVPQVGKMIDKGKVSRAKGDVRSIANAILEFHNDTGEWPWDPGFGKKCITTRASSLTYDPEWNPYDGNGVLKKDPGISGWNGPYLDKDIPKKDPWGRSYAYWPFFDEWTDYSSTSKCADWYSGIMSAGPNGKTDSDASQPGGRIIKGDDIVIWLE